MASWRPPILSTLPIYPSTPLPLYPCTPLRLLKAAGGSSQASSEKLLLPTPIPSPTPMPIHDAVFTRYFRAQRTLHACTPSKLHFQLQASALPLGIRPLFSACPRRVAPCRTVPWIFLHLVYISFRDAHTPLHPPSSMHLHIRFYDILTI